MSCLFVGLPDVVKKRQQKTVLARDRRVAAENLVHRHRFLPEVGLAQGLQGAFDVDTFFKKMQ